jgi:glycosyltransferase involved in cell wall biosynthesis
VKIALLDQSFHKKTGSTRFLLDLLRPLGTVDHFFVDENDLTEVADRKFDVIILFQTEFCAPYFLARGKRTVIIPMYDACVHMPEVYWRAMAGARVISFCRRLHVRMLECGLESMYLQYFPDPSTIQVVDDFSNLRGFLWQRRPREGFNWRLVSHLCGSSLASLRVHLAADDGDNGLERLPLGVTTMSGFADSNDVYLAHVRAANVFFAPRATEGIGMANLEAMAYGMCVVAHDDATANEYVIHQENGYLYNVRNPERLALTSAKAQKCGGAARKTVEDGYERFREKLDDLLSFISSTSKPSPLYRNQFPPKEFVRTARLIFADAPGMDGLLTKVEGRGAFTESMIRMKRRVRRIPVLGAAAKEIYGWMRGH